MPEEITQQYVFGGWRTTTIYSEQEMSDALGMTCVELRGRIATGNYGFSYHAHPSSNALHEYQFNQESFDENIKRWACVKAGGHNFVFEKYYDQRLRKRKFICSGCGLEKYD